MTDEELLEIAKYFLEIKVTCMSWNYIDKDIKEEIKNNREKVISDIKDEFQNLLGICGCSDTDEIFKGIYAFLNIVNNKTKDPHNKEKADQVYSWIIDNWENYFIANVLDDKGLLDHGTSIRCCWITELGEWYLKIFDKSCKED